MNHTTKRAHVREATGITFSRNNPALVRILRAASEPETFEAVRQVLRLRNLRGGLEREGDFMKSILDTRRAEFVPSVVLIRDATGEKEVEDSVGMEVIRGSIDQIGELRLSEERNRQDALHGFPITHNGSFR